MSISDSDYKILWGRAAGKCSNPTCKKDLTVVLEDTRAYHRGEMAHMIAKKESGPRGQSGGGSNAYCNLILLCSSCHTDIDNAPEGVYTEAMLLEWKRMHEEGIREYGSKIKFDTFDELKKVTKRKLQENRHLWLSYGPKSLVAQNDPSSNANELWELHKIGNIVPNNIEIVNYIDNNIDLLPDAMYSMFLSFKTHASAFEHSQYHRSDNYPLFPQDFGREFGCE